jgi:hypothetical protein
VGNYHENYETLLTNGCKNIFETVEFWHRASISFDNKIQLNLCNKKNFKLFLSSSELKQEACNLVLSYFYLVSKSIQNRQKTCIDERITAFNMPNAIERLQSLFMESTAVRYYVVRNLLRSGGRFIAGIDATSFFSFRTELFRYQEKRFADRKCQSFKEKWLDKIKLSEEFQKCIKRQVDQQNFRLGIELFQSCNLKTYRKNYKGDVVKIFRFFKCPNSARSQYVLTLRDRLLQMVVDAAVHPIIEYQSDPHSFAYRPNRSATDAIVLVVNRLEHLNKQETMGGYLGSKVFNGTYRPIESQIEKV